MSTRGAIARAVADGFEGRYHHWDSYPTALGKTLWDLYHGFFQHDLDIMLKVLIDDHPAGWSTINGADFSKEPGYIGTFGHDKTTGFQPVCYCHGDRHEEGWLVTDKNAAGSGVEWVYVFNDKRQMLVMSSIGTDGKKMIGAFGMGDPDATWHIAAVVDLDRDEPDWRFVQEGGMGAKRSG
jgi:hypothetical protein